MADAQTFFREPGAQIVVPLVHDAKGTRQHYHRTVYDEPRDFRNRSETDTVDKEPKAPGRVLRNDDCHDTIHTDVWCRVSFD